MPAKPSSSHHHLLSWAALLLPPLFWAGNFIVGRAIREDLAPITLSLGRWAIALVCLLPFALGPIRREWRRYWEIRWRLTGLALSGVVAFSSLVYLGLRTTTASNALLFNSLVPLLIVMLGAGFYRQRLSRGQGVGLLLSFMGVLTLIMQGRWSHWQNLTFVPGDLIILAAMVCWALYTLWLRQLPADLDRIGLMAMQIIIGLMALLPLCLIERASGLQPAWNSASLAALTYLGIFPSVLAYLLYGQAVRHFGPARAGLANHLIPAFGVLLSVLFLHERLHTYHVVGISAIAAGLVCSNLGRRRVSLTPGSEGGPAERG